MCTVSNIGDQYRDDFPRRWPNIPIQPPITYPGIAPSKMAHPFQPTQDALRECVVCGNERSHPIHSLFETNLSPVSPEDFAALKREVEELRELLKAAKRFDEATDQPDCELDEKVAFLRTVAEFVGVDLDEVFGDKT